MVPISLIFLFHIIPKFQEVCCGAIVLCPSHTHQAEFPRLLLFLVKHYSNAGFLPRGDCADAGEGPQPGPNWGGRKPSRRAPGQGAFPRRSRPAAPGPVALPSPDTSLEVAGLTQRGDVTAGSSRGAGRGHPERRPRALVPRAPPRASLPRRLVSPVAPWAEGARGRGDAMAEGVRGEPCRRRGCGAGAAGGETEAPAGSGPEAGCAARSAPRRDPVLSGGQQASRGRCVRGAVLSRGLFQWLAQTLAAHFPGCFFLIHKMKLVAYDLRSSWSIRAGFRARWAVRPG